MLVQITRINGCNFYASHTFFSDAGIFYLNIVSIKEPFYNFKLKDDIKCVIGHKMINIKFLQQD